MASLNKAQIIGHLGQAPEIRSFQNGGKIANLSVATTRKWKTRAGDVQERTEWHRISITAEGLVGVVERFAGKGSRVYIEGRLETRKWQDQTGVDRFTTEIIVAPYEGTLILLGDPRGASGGAVSGADPQSGGGSAYDDEIPF